MKLNFFEKEKLTPEQKEASNQRKEYDKFAGKRAWRANTLKENLIGGVSEIDKKDVIENDAYFENEVRNLMKLGKISEKEFEQLVNNSLTYKYYENPMKGIKYKVVQTIEGEINGQLVKLEYTDQDKDPYHEYVGTINNKPLTDSDAHNLFDRCAKIISKRDRGIEEIKEDRYIKVEKARIAKIAEKEARERQGKSDSFKAKKDQTEEDVKKIL